eukprot:scaffold10373_cov118-Isochrysis_galbana.AAC.9
MRGCGWRCRVSWRRRLWRVRGGLWSCGSWQSASIVQSRSAQSGVWVSGPPGQLASKSERLASGASLAIACAVMRTCARRRV